MLVGEVGDGGLREEAEGVVGASRGKEGRADGKEVGYEGGVVEGCSEDDCSAPEVEVRGVTE